MGQKPLKKPVKSTKLGVPEKGFFLDMPVPSG